MSHEATNWAISQRGLKPSAKIVLWHLCDRHNPDFGCFPSQELLAFDCEMSRSTLNIHLKNLEEIGLIYRIREVDEVTKKQCRTRYEFAFESGELMPKAESGNRTRETPKAESEKCPKPSPKNAKSRVRIPDSNPVREPVREPLIADAARKEVLKGDCDAEKAKQSQKIETAFWRTIKDWPGFAGMPKTKALAEWKNLTDEERCAAEDKRDAWLALLRSNKKDHTPAPSTYFSQKLWRDVREPDAVQQPVLLKPYGKGWMAHRLALLPLARCKWVPTSWQQKMIDLGKSEMLRGDRHRREFPQVALMDDDAQNGKGMVLPAQTPMPDIENYVRVKQGSPEWGAWENWHMANDYPWINPEKFREYIWLPATLPVMGETEKEDECVDG